MNQFHFNAWNSKWGKRQISKCSPPFHNTLFWTRCILWNTSSYKYTLYTVFVFTQSMSRAPKYMYLLHVWHSQKIITRLYYWQCNFLTTYMLSNTKQSSDYVCAFKHILSQLTDWKKGNAPVPFWYMSM